MLRVITEWFQILDVVLSQLIEGGLRFLLLETGSLGRCSSLHPLISDELENIFNAVLNILKVLGGCQSVMVEKLELRQLMVLQIFELLLDFARNLLEGLLLLEVEHFVLLLEELDVLTNVLLAELASSTSQHVGELLVLDLDLQLGVALLFARLDQFLHLLNRDAIVYNVELTAEHLVLTLQLATKLFELLNLGLSLSILNLQFTQSSCSVTGRGVHFFLPLTLVLLEISLVHL